MSESVLGSPFEHSLRILFLLNEMHDFSLDEQQIGTIDYISVYAADFCLMDENLHGYGTYRFGEYYARKNKIHTAMKQLTLDGFVRLHLTPTGYRYSITDEGESFCSKIINTYTQEYLIAVKAVVERYGIEDIEPMTKEINRLTVEALKEDGHE